MTKLHLGKKTINILLPGQAKHDYMWKLWTLLSGILILISNFLFTEELMKTQSPRYPGENLHRCTLSTELGCSPSRPPAILPPPHPPRSAVQAACSLALPHSLQGCAHSGFV